MACEVERTGGKELKSYIAELFHKLGFSPHGKVFIKPNLSAREGGLSSENSDLKFTRSLVKYLLERKCEVIIGHRANLPTLDLTFPFKRIAEIAGFNSLKGMKGLRILDLDKAPQKRVSFKGVTFHVPKIVYDADVYIDLAKMKTHMQTYVSLSLKNQMGLIPPAERRKVHRTSLGKLIAYLGKVARPDISIIEGLPGMEGNGPHHGRNKVTNLVLAGDDMVELDSLACSLMGLDLREAEHIVIAAKIGVGKMADGRTKRRFEQFKLKFKPPQKFIRKGLALYTWPTSACPGCLKALEEAANRLIRKPDTALRFFARALIRTNFVLGRCEDIRKRDLNGRSYGFGNCAREFCEKHRLRHFRGCPMSSKKVEQILRGAL